MQSRNKQPNLQTEQTGIEYPAEGQGWPKPLTDQSNPITHKYTVGKSGETVGKPVTKVQATTTPVDME